MANAKTLPAIDVQNVTKRFRYWSERPTSIKTLMVNALSGKLNFGKKEEFYALENVSFTIQPGEFVGIMGRNGAGKSTLLKLISGIYTPTSGTIVNHGGIAPLIELGAGFHGELSGYENIFLNASILGHGRAVTMEAVPKILEFAEIGEKIHMPVKKYSSGMLVRLGFSIAAHLTAPTILIDELLSVGDAGFQAKCLKKVQSLHEEGRTILLVTHNPEAISRHCQRCIVIDQRKKIYDGPAERGTQIYLEVAK